MKRVARTLLWALATVAALTALMILVPDGAMLALTDSAPLCEVAGVAIYPYGLIIALAAALGLWLERYGIRRRFGALSDQAALPAAAPLLSGALGAFLCARLVYCLANLEFILADFSASFLPQTWLGGFSLAGAVPGAALGVWLCARLSRRSAPLLLDASVPAGALVLALGRLAEATTGQGLGDYVMSESLHVFPLSVANAYGEFQLPVYFYEACAALGILLCALHELRCGRADAAGADKSATRPGAVALHALLALCATQVLLESLREDEFIRFGFVRFTQLCAMLGMAVPLCVWTRCRGRAFWLRLLGLCACAGICAAVEFALDKSPVSPVVLYLCMAAALVAAYCVVRSAEGRGTGTRDGDAGAPPQTPAGG